jgi:hypothetical protein
MLDDRTEAPRMNKDFQQTEKSQAKNTEFFLNHIDAYSANVGAIDTYHRIAGALSMRWFGRVI